MALKAFTMPKWGIEMAEGTVAEWMVREGEPFARGAVLALIETDKITNEVEAEADGCFVRLVARVAACARPMFWLQSPMPRRRQHPLRLRPSLPPHQSQMRQVVRRMLCPCLRCAAPLRDG
jgi:hypothetical protein